MMGSIIIESVTFSYKDQELKHYFAVRDVSKQKTIYKKLSCYG